MLQAATRSLKTHLDAQRTAGHGVRGWRRVSNSQPLHHFARRQWPSVRARVCGTCPARTYAVAGSRDGSVPRVSAHPGNSTREWRRPRQSCAVLCTSNLARMHSLHGPQCPAICLIHGKPVRTRDRSVEAQEHVATRDHHGPVFPVRSQGNGAIDQLAVSRCRSMMLAGAWAFRTANIFVLFLPCHANAMRPTGCGMEW